jgi:hypothetical protein
MIERPMVSVSNAPYLSATGAIVLAALVIAITTSCNSHVPSPQLGWGWVTNCAGPEFSKFGGSGPGPQRPVFRITDQLVPAVPKNYRPYGTAIDREPRECRTINDLPRSNFLGFVFAGNWSAGYKREDVPSLPDLAAKDVRPDLVTVRIDRESPITRSAEEQQKIDEMLREAHARDLQGGAREVAGLTCVVPKIPYYPWFFCSGPRSVGSELVKLQFKQENSSFVLILADYSSSRYGGTRIYWKTVISDISHWRDIDQEMWRLLADWNLLGSAYVDPKDSQRGS